MADKTFQDIDKILTYKFVQIPNEISWKIRGEK